MRPKTYRAKSMKEALTRVRRDLGGDAVILSRARSVVVVSSAWARGRWSRSRPRTQCRES